MIKNLIVFNKVQFLIVKSYMFLICPYMSYMVQKNRGQLEWVG